MNFYCVQLLPLHHERICIMYVHNSLRTSSTQHNTWYKTYCAHCFHTIRPTHLNQGLSQCLFIGEQEAEENQVGQLPSHIMDGWFLSLRQHCSQP